MPAIPKMSTNGSSQINKIAPQLLAMAVDIDTLVPDPNNARLHPDGNVETIRESFLKYGQVHPLLCREATRVIIVGNGRWKVAKDLGWTKIAAHFVPVTEIEAAGLGLVDNRSAELAKWDMEMVGRIQRLQQELGDPSLGWDDDYIYTIAELPDWKPQAQSEEDGGEQRPSSITIKLTAGQRRLLEDCIKVAKERYGSVKVTDGIALAAILQEWLCT